MKVENNHNAQRLAQKQSESAGAVEKNLRSQEGDGRLDTLSGKDRASLSERARLLAKARTALAEAPQVRSERVEQLRGQIQSGAYEVPFEALARNMVSRLKDL